MRSRDFLFWITVILSLIFASRVYSAPPELRAVCEIDESGGQGSGTLVAVNDTNALILTVRHVAKQPGNLMEFHWRNAGGQITYGKTLETLPYTTHDEHEIGFWNSDLALAVCKKPKGIEPVKYAPFDGTSGPWVGVGFTDGLTIVTSSHYTVEAGVIFFDHQFVPGMSGGPVFNHHGELVAVVSGYNAKLDIGLACDGPRLQKLLDEYGL